MLERCISAACSFCLPSCIEVRAWLTVCWLERRQFFSWAAADCGDEVGLTELAEFTSGVEGRVEEGPGDPGDAGSAILFPTWLQPPPPPLTGLDKQERAPVPKGALQRGEKGGESGHQFREAVLCWFFGSDWTLNTSEVDGYQHYSRYSVKRRRPNGSLNPWMFPSLTAAGAEAILVAPNERFSKIILILLYSGRM